MDAHDSFSDEAIRDFVRITNQSDYLRVVTHEGVAKEFKQSFTWGPIGLYVRTMAAFVNAHGEYLIFGVTDKPRIAKGLTDSSQISFDELDRAKFPELKQIIDDAKIREQRSMMRHVEELVKAGASNATVLDFGEATLQGPTGERVLAGAN